MQSGDVDGGYGIYDDLKPTFKNPDDPFEYVPVKLKALVGRNRNEDQESATGLYPHAGLLRSFQYLRRYPTTETNRNRLWARMYFLHFLGIDALELAARVSDAAAVSAKYEIVEAARFTGNQLDGDNAEFTVADQRFCFSIPAEYSGAEAAPL